MAQSLALSRTPHQHPLPVCVALSYALSFQKLIERWGLAPDLFPCGDLDRSQSHLNTTRCISCELKRISFNLS
eukprot:6211201-Pleurochrysis_carterae.AAC.1